MSSACDPYMSCISFWQTSIVFPTLLWVAISMVVKWSHKSETKSCLIFFRAIENRSSRKRIKKTDPDLLRLFYYQGGILGQAGRICMPFPQNKCKWGSMYCRTIHTVCARTLLQASWNPLALVFLCKGQAIRRSDFYLRQENSNLSAHQSECKVTCCLWCSPQKNAMFLLSTFCSPFI